MEYYVFKDGQNLGPMPDQGVIDGLRAGRYAPNDLGCRVGETRWQDLSVLFPFEGHRPAYAWQDSGRNTAPVYEQPRRQPQAAYQQPAPLVYQPNLSGMPESYLKNDYNLLPRWGGIIIDQLIAIPLIIMAVIPFIGIIGAPLLVLYWISRDALMGGQSVGKRVAGLKVIKADGSPFTWSDSVKRNIVYFGFLLLMIPFYGWFFSGLINGPLGLVELIMIISGGRRIGDRMGTETYVVRV